MIITRSAVHGVFLSGHKSPATQCGGVLVFKEHKMGVIRVSHLLQRLWEAGENGTVRIPPEMFEHGELLVVNDCNAETLDLDNYTENKK